MRKILTLLLCMSFLLISLVGCQDSANKPMTPAKKPGTTVEKKSSTEMTASERRVMANRLSKTAESVAGVKRASVIVASIGMTNSGVNSISNDMTNNNYNNSTNNNMTKNNGTNNMTNNMTKNNAAKNNVSGQVIMVGLTLEPTSTRDTATINNVKSAVANKLKASDKNISQVLVTTDPNMINRINDVAAGIIEGKPIENFKEDINDLSSQIKQQRPAF